MWQKTKNYYHLLVSVVANVMHQFPSRKLFVIGITGTDGKTTTSSLIYHILKESGRKVALITTVGARIGNKELDTGFHTSTPSPLALQRYIKQAVKGRQEYLVLEVTSHALDQNRVAGIPFQIGVLTNITREHLDYHKTYEKYAATKIKLLKRAKVAILNRDDESYGEISNIKYQMPNAKFKDKKWITYGLNTNSDINPFIFPFKTNLSGEFNRYNCLAAVAVCRQIGLTDQQIREGLETFKAPIGRQDVVYDKGFTVMIDYAHTPNAFNQLLPYIRKQTKGRIIHVFGAASKRDTYKRPFMGEIASEYDDIIILTAEDPRGEAVEKINREIVSKIPRTKFQIPNNVQYSNFKIKMGEKYLIEISDRREAIEFAVSIAQKGDFVVTTGKGHEKSMNYGYGEEPWDEFKVVKESLEKKHAE